MLEHSGPLIVSLFSEILKQLRIPAEIAQTDIVDAVGKRTAVDFKVPIRILLDKLFHFARQFAEHPLRRRKVKDGTLRRLSDWCSVYRSRYQIRLSYSGRIVDRRTKGRYL